jgi:hypothetical protein
MCYFYQYMTDTQYQRIKYLYCEQITYRRGDSDWHEWSWLTWGGRRSIQSVPITTKVVSSNSGGVLDTTLCDKFCQWLVAGLRFPAGTLVSSTNKTDCRGITEIFLKVPFNTIILLDCILLQTYHIKTLCRTMLCKDASTVFSQNQNFHINSNKNTLSLKIEFSKVCFLSNLLSSNSGGVLDTTLCDKFCQWRAAGRWFFPVSSTNKTDQDITEILLKVALNTINLNHCEQVSFHSTKFILF